MRTSCSLGSLLSVQDVLACAKRLEHTDVDTVWIPETWGMEGFATLSAVSGAIPHAHVGSSIINVYSRSPAAIAMGAATVDTISNGRLILGLGASSPAIVSGLHGMKYDTPLRRVRETVDIVRLALSGGKMDYNGHTFSMHGFSLLIKPVRNSIPIYLAAINQNMVRLAWRIADGAIFYLRPLDEMRSTINKARTESGKTIDVACQIITCVSDDGNLAMERARKTIAFYIAVGEIYRNFLAENGFADITDAVYQRFKSDGLGTLHHIIPDDMVNKLAIAGTPKGCKKQLGLFRDAGVALPILQFNPVGKDTMRSFDMFAETFFHKRYGP